MSMEMIPHSYHTCQVYEAAYDGLHPSPTPLSLLLSLLQSLRTYPCWFRMKRECSIAATICWNALASSSWRLYRGTCVLSAPRPGLYSGRGQRER